MDACGEGAMGFQGVTIRGTTQGAGTQRGGTQGRTEEWNPGGELMAGNQGVGGPRG